MEGDIYPGNWQWVVRGIYTGRDPSTDETQMFFQFAYLFEQVRQREPGRPVDAGFYVLRVGSSDAMARVARAVRSEEHTSELQSQSNLVCRLLLEKKKKKQK